MSYYTHPYFAASPYGAPAPAPAPYYYPREFATGPYPPPPPPPFAHYPGQPLPPASYGHPQPQAAYPDFDPLDDEEARVLAQLQEIRARRRTQATDPRAALQRQKDEDEKQYRLLKEKRQEAKAAAAAAAAAAAEAKAKAQAEAQAKARAEAVNKIIAKEKAIALYIAAREQAIERAKAERDQVLRAREQEQKARQQAQAARVEFINRQRQQQLAAAQAQAQAQARYAQEIQRRQQYAEKVRAARAQSPAPAAKKEEGKANAELDGLNQLLGALFGINLVDDAPAPASTPAPAATEATKQVKFEEKAHKLEAPAKSTPAPTSAPATAKAAREAEPAIPAELNNLLSHYLGVRVEPQGKDETPASNASNSVPAGLNELLGQWGLEFVPDETRAAQPTAAPVAGPSEKKSTATKESTPSAPFQAAADKHESASTPLTDFLNNTTNLPPFVRDILGNIELAWKEGSNEVGQESVVEGKGKGVAEGEKPKRAAAPAPAAAPASPASEPTVSDASTSLDTLNTISRELDLVRDTFTFPATLAFSTNPPTQDSPTPALLYNRLNKPYHAHANKLLQLLLQADSITSNGDKDVRNKRKEVVRSVEQELENLEKKRDAVWQEVKEKRERGEVDEDEHDGWSTGSSGCASVIDHEEAHTQEEVVAPAATAEEAIVSEPEVVEAPATAHDETKTATPSYAEVAATATEPEPEVEQEVTGFDLPVPEPQQVTAPVEEAEVEQKEDETAEAPKVVVEEEQEVKSNQEAKEEVVKTDAKEEGYELI